jgi:hypothetical protein
MTGCYRLRRKKRMDIVCRAAQFRWEKTVIACHIAFPALFRLSKFGQRASLGVEMHVDGDVGQLTLRRSI